jgi:hypothetical protein
VPTDSIYQRFTAFAAQFRADHPGTAVDGDYYDLPGTTVYHTATHPLPAKGRLEVNTVTPAAADHFEWASEITLNDKVSGQFIHLIARRAGDVVETYGKTILPIDAARADEILTALEQAQSVG